MVWCAGAKVDNSGTKNYGGKGTHKSCHACLVNLKIDKPVKHLDCPYKSGGSQDLTQMWKAVCIYTLYTSFHTKCYGTQGDDTHNVYGSDHVIL